MLESDAKRKGGWWSRLVGTEAEVEAARAEAEEVFKWQQREIARLEEALGQTTVLQAQSEERGRTLERELQGLSQVAMRHAELLRQAEFSQQETRQRLNAVEALYEHQREESSIERQRFEEQRGEWNVTRAGLEAEVTSLRESMQEGARKSESQRITHLRDLEALRVSTTKERARAEAATAEVRASLSEASAKVQALQEELTHERHRHGELVKEHEARHAELERNLREQRADAEQQVAEANARASTRAAELEQMIAQWKARLSAAQTLEADARRRAMMLQRQVETTSAEVANLKGELSKANAATQEQTSTVDRLRAALAEMQQAAMAAEQQATSNAGQIELLSATIATERERSASAVAGGVRLQRELEESHAQLRAERTRVETAQRRLDEERARTTDLSTRVHVQQFELDAMRSSVDDLTRERDAAREQGTRVRRSGTTMVGVALTALRMTLGDRSELPLRVALSSEAARAAANGDGAERFFQMFEDFDAQQGGEGRATVPQGVDDLAAWWATVLARGLAAA